MTASEYRGLTKYFPKTFTQDQIDLLNSDFFGLRTKDQFIMRSSLEQEGHHQSMQSGKYIYPLDILMGSASRG